MTFDPDAVLYKEKYKKAKGRAVYDRLWSAAISKKFGFSQVPRVVIQKPKKLHRCIKTTHVAILAHLISRYSTPEKWPNPSIQRLSTDLGIDTKTIRSHTRQLEEWGLITTYKQRQVKKFKNNVYNLLPLIVKLDRIAKGEDVSNEPDAEEWFKKEYPKSKRNPYK